MTQLSKARWPASRLRCRLVGVGGRVGLFWLAAGLAGGCADPVRQAQIDALGAEDPGVLPGPLHRPGQPCLLCHTAGGLAPAFTVAGTVFRTPASAAAVGGVEVQLIDATRHWFIAHTNCAGNFYVAAPDYAPVMPLWVSLFGQGLHADMDSPMNKDGDCGTCHKAQKNPMSAGQVYLMDDPPTADDAPPSACAGTLP